MAEQLLKGDEIAAGFEIPRREGMTEVVEADILESRSPARGFEGTLDID